MIGGQQPTLRHYPQVIQESGQRPDAVMASKKTGTIIIAELTVPWEDRMEQSNVLKERHHLFNQREFGKRTQHQGIHIKPKFGFDQLNILSYAKIKGC